jgi:choline monooxygenase
VDAGKNIAAYYFWVFPNMMFNFYPWGLSLNIVTPIDAGNTKVTFLSFVYDASKLDTGAGAGLESVEQEDEEVVEHVQQGIHSRFYHHGRYATKREQGTHHFHSLLAEFMNQL